MSERVHRDGTTVVKSLRKGAAVDALLLATLTQQLEQAGVATPACQALDTQRLSYLWIDGQSARERYQQPLMHPSADWPKLALLSHWLPPLVALHRVTPSVTVPHLDPWQRVTPRLRATPDPELARLWERLRQRWAITDGHPVLLHGDFHLGQILLEATTGTPWLLDLEDAALGPPEFDLGNFAAHLLTTPEQFQPQRLPSLLARISESYTRLSRHPIEPQRLELCCHAALLRRTLKLRDSIDGRARYPALRDWLLNYVSSAS